MAPTQPYWPRAMRLATAAAYCDLTPSEFMKEVESGVLPHGFRLGRGDHWDRSQIDKAFDRLAGEEDDWRVGSPLYADTKPLPAKAKAAAPPQSTSKPNAFSVATLADRWQCSGSLVRNLIAQGKLESFRFGNLIRITPAAVAAFEGTGMTREPKAQPGL